LREVEAGGGESTGVAVGERVVVSARIRFEKLQVVDLPNDDEDEDEDEVDDDSEDDENEDEEENPIEERERTSSEVADTLFNAEVSSDGSVKGDAASSSSNKRGTVGWFGDSATSRSAAVVNSESGANVAGSSTDAVTAANAADYGGAAAADGSINSLYGVLREVAQGGMMVVQGVLRRQPEDVTRGWAQASNALAPPLLWAVRAYITLSCPIYNGTLCN